MTLPPTQRVDAEAAVCSGSHGGEGGGGRPGTAQGGVRCIGTRQGSAASSGGAPKGSGLTEHRKFLPAAGQSELWVYGAQQACIT